MNDYARGKRKFMRSSWVGLLLMLVLLSGCDALEELALVRSVPPQGTPAEVITSPSGRYDAQLWRCCYGYNYISGFDIYDSQAKAVYRQDLRDVEGLYSSTSGVHFEWTPSETYLVIVTDNPGTVHGCDEVLVYTGDGSDLIYNTAPSSVCKRVSADAHLHDIALCANDDIVYNLAGQIHRLTPGTGQIEFVGSMTCDEEP